MRIDIKEDQRKFIEEVNTILPAERAKVIKDAEPLLQEILYGHDKVIATVKAIPHEKADVLQHVKSLSFLKRLTMVIS